MHGCESVQEVVVNLVTSSCYHEIVVDPGAYGPACVNRCLDLPYYLEVILLMRYTGLREMDPVHVVSEPLAQEATTTTHEERQGLEGEGN